MLSSETVIPDDLEQKTLKTSELQILVKDWIELGHLNKKQTTYRYKFNLSNILPLPQNLIHNFILYICYIKFPFVIQNLTIEQKMKINLFLKSVYQHEFYHGRWKNQFFFQFSMVFLTKTTTKFISQYFPSLQINENLQSQIFIILHSVMIGNQIGTKIFQIISNKYIKIIIPKSAKKPIKASISVAKKDSLITLYKPSNKYISEVMHSQSYGGTKHKILYGKENPIPGYPQNVNSRRNNYRNKISFLKTDAWQRSNLEIFSQQLKKNLHVEPLPIIKPKKMDISEYEQVRYGTVQSKQKRMVGEMFAKPVNLRTTKITSSMETLISLNHPNFSTHQQDRPGKIILSRQLNSKHYCLTSCSNHNNSSDKHLAQIFEKDPKSKHNSSKHTGKLSYEEWNQLLSKIRLNSKNSTMFEKQNVVLGKSFDSKSQNQTINQISYERSLHKDDSRQLQSRSNRIAEDPFMNRLATQHYPTNHFVANIHRKSQSLQNSDDIEKSKYGKLGQYTTTIDPGHQVQNINAPVNEQTQSLFKKLSTQSQQKLSKTSKLKLAKLNFLSECKKRENKLSETNHGHQIKMVMY